MEPIKLAVLVSGRGSNLQAIMDQIKEGHLFARIAVVISDFKDADALNKAQKEQIPTAFLDPQEYLNREAYDNALAVIVNEHQSDLVVLAGFMRVLGKGFLARFPNRVINIHPALLPAFPGIQGQKQALDYGVKISGCTVHFVDEGVDSGPIIAQSTVIVEDDDTEESLSERILAKEHQLYSQAIQLIAEGRVQVLGRKVRINKRRCQG